MLSLLRLLDSPLGEEACLDAEVNLVVFLVADFLERSLCTCSVAEQR